MKKADFLITLCQYFQSLRENAGVNDMSRDLTPNLESVDDTQSLDLDVQSEVSEVRPLRIQTRFD